MMTQVNVSLDGESTLLLGSRQKESGVLTWDSTACQLYDMEQVTTSYPMIVGLMCQCSYKS